jgi:glycosyltransferase involved in cell wall biosynthesis
MRDMKVLHVEMGRYLYGGARQVAYLLDGLAKYPGEHILVCAEGAEIAEAIENPAVRIYPLAMRGDLDPGFMSRLRRVIRAERPDLLHAHSRRGELLTALAGRLENLPMIYSRRVDNPPRWLDRHLKFPLFGKIIAISEGIRGALLQVGVSGEQVTCVPSAVDTERYRPECEGEWFLREFSLESKQPVLAVIAQLIERKGHAVLFDALPAVLSRHADLQVMVFGQGPLESRLRQAVRQRGLERCVRFEGFRADLDRIIPCLDLIVHPAFMEGLGVSLLEAAACGMPIIASRVGGIPEAVRHGLNGYLVEPGDSKAIAGAINDLLDCPEKRREFGRAGRKIVLERFSIQRMVEGNYRVYQSLLVGGAPNESW